MATNQPFTILALRLEETPELKALAEAGHRIIYASQITCEGATVTIDQVMGPDCWRLLPDQMKWVPLALKEMRAKQPKGKKGKKSATPAGISGYLITKGTDGTPTS